MTNWDYRVIEHNGMFTIHEVCYSDNGDITAISQDPMGPSGDTMEELKADIEYFLHALDMPALKKDEIVFAPGDEE